jgi:cell division protein FtsQ
MKDGSLIQLPAVGEEQALMELEQLDQRSRILDLGFERIDLRNPDVVAVRPREPGPPGQLPPAGA